MGFINNAYRYLVGASAGAGANIQSKVNAGGSAYSWGLKVGGLSTSKIDVDDGESVRFTGSNGLSATRTDRVVELGANGWVTQSGSLLVSKGTSEVEELTQGTNDYFLRVKTEDPLGMAWEAVASDNYYADSLAFTTGDGTLTIGRTSPLADLTTSLDGRYLTSQYGQAGATNYVGYFSGTNNITGTSGLQYDASTFTVTGGHVTSIVNIVTDPVGNIYRMGSTDYHVHITNAIEPVGINQPITLPAISIGRVVYLSTSGSTPAGGGTNLITLSASGSDTINTALSSTVLSTNGNNNYDIFKFVAESATNWVGAKMEAVS